MLLDELLEKQSTPSSSREVQEGLATLARLLIDNWAWRISWFARNRENPITDLWDLAAGVISEVFAKGRNLRKLPESLRKFVKHAIAQHLRLVAREKTGDVKGQFLAGKPQWEITLHFDHDDFLDVRDRIDPFSIFRFLNTRRDSLIHELRHAYDEYESGGKYLQNPKSRRAQLDRATARANPSPENQQRAYTSYLREPAEIIARFSQTLDLIRNDLRGPWKDYLSAFISKMGGWKVLSPSSKRKLIKRLAAHWTTERAATAIDIEPYIRKLNAKLRADNKDVWVSPAHGNIEVDLHKLAKPDQASVLNQVTYLADIFRRQVVTYDNSPILKGFGFVRNTGRNVDYRISASFRREPRNRDKLKTMRESTDFDPEV